MSDLSEAFTQPLMNHIGVYHELSGDDRRDYPKILAEWTSLIFHSDLDEQFDQRNRLRLDRDDYRRYLKSAYHKSAKQLQLRASFYRRWCEELSQLNLFASAPRQPVDSYIDGPVDYFAVRNEYEEKIVAIGPYTQPVWLQADES